MNSNQKTLSDLGRNVIASSANLSVAATAAAIIALIIPFVGMTTTLGFGVSTSGSMNGFAAANWAAWVTALAFIGASASRRLPPLAPYRNLIDMAAIGGAALTLIKAYFFNPAASTINDMTSAFVEANAHSGNAVSLYPNIGMFLLVVAAVGIVAAYRKDRHSEAI